MPFDGACLDTSGRGSHGTQIGNTTFVAGKIGSGVLHYNTDTASGVYNCVMVYSFDRKGNATVYRDGVMENQTSIASGAAWNLDTGMIWCIGQAGGSYGETAAFDMDDMGIWRRALSSYEALSIYNAALSGRSFGCGFTSTGSAATWTSVGRRALSCNPPR